MTTAWSNPAPRAFTLLCCLGLGLLALLLPRPAHGFHHASPPGIAARTARPTTFLPSATAARLPKTGTTTPQPHLLHAEGSSSSSSSTAGGSAAAASASSPTARLCKNCKNYFEPTENHDRACRYHTKSYTGDTKRKGDWSANADRFENERQWWCCGEPALDAPGCKYDRHRSYDDE